MNPPEPHNSSYNAAGQDFNANIRQHSPEAADCLEQIRTRYGERAAYLAAFALHRLKQMQDNRPYLVSRRDVYNFTFCEEMQDNADALRLYETAAAHLLPGVEGLSAATD